jgi:hypothetical protein
MNRCRLLVLLVLAVTGCASGDETRIICLTDCDHSAIFNLAKPASGRQLSITVGQVDGSVLRIDCQTGDGSVSCVPVSSLTATFDATGALTSIKVAYPPNGTLAVQIVADGEPVAAGTVQYEPPMTGGGACGPAACVGSQTFTIGS